MPKVEDLPKVGSRAYFRWDANHHQPHTDLGGVRKFFLSFLDADAWLRLAGRNLLHLPEVAESYSLLREEPRTPKPTAREFFGLAISPTRETFARYEEKLEELSVRSVVIRVPVWDPEPVFALAEDFARLRSRGARFTFALLQDREAVDRPDRWSELLLRAGEILGPLRPAFQIGQAPNRKKWGLWRPDEYFRLLEAAAAARDAHPEARWIGPGVIDFEYYFTLNYLFGERPFRFDGVSALLYCDRRGSPATPQYGHFDLRRKIELLRALVDVSPEGSAPLHLTEFNWPLRGDLRHSPAGPRVTTTEALQARYLVQYYLIAASTGLVEDASWWQLVAKGYGLLDADDAWSERPAYRAFRELLARAAGATITEIPERQGVSGFLVERSGRRSAFLSCGRGEFPLDRSGRVDGAATPEGVPLDPKGLRLSAEPVWIELGDVPLDDLIRP